MEMLGSAIVSISFVVFLWAAVGLIQPRWARIPNRGTAVAIWVLSVVLLAAGDSLRPDTPDVVDAVETPTQRSQNVGGIPGDAALLSEMTTAVRGVGAVDWRYMEPTGDFAERMLTERMISSVTGEPVGQSGERRTFRYAFPDGGELWMYARPCGDEDSGLCVFGVGSGPDESASVVTRPRVERTGISAAEFKSSVMWNDMEPVGVFADRMPPGVTGGPVGRTGETRNFRYTFPAGGSLEMGARPCSEGEGLCVYVVR